MQETLSSVSFWFYCALWFVFLMIITPRFEEWNWKQAVFIGVISGPIGWVFTVIGAIIAGLAEFWELLGKSGKSKKS